MPQENDPRLISIWNGNSFYFKTFQDSDDYYYTVITSPDFATKAQVEQFNATFIERFRTYPNG